ncbi:MAG: hypothetical protein U0V45_12835 [Flavobacteriales bacterium]
MKNLLLITPGQTDVQLVQQGKRHELDKRSCGLLLDELDKRGFALVDAPKDKDKVAITELPDGPLEVCTPKLDAVLRTTKKPTAVLILETTRKRASDPGAGGQVLEKRLRGHGVEQVQRVSFLSGDEWLEDTKNPLDAVVRREVALRFDKAIREALQGLTPNDRVYVATTGGLPPANELINELVRLHAVGGPTVTALEVPDSTTGEKDDQAIPEKFHPAAGYRARWHALDLIEKGNLLAAWGAVSHLKGAPGQEWSKLVETLAAFAASLPLPHNLGLPHLRHKTLCVPASLRVELALRAGDIPRAVHATFAFYELVLRGHLLKHFNPEPYYSDNYYPKGKEHVPPDKLVMQNPKDDRPFEQRDYHGKTYYWFREKCSLRFAKEYIRSAALEALCKAITPPKEDAHKSVKRLRNDVAHGEPSPMLMQQAKDTMSEAGLWSKQDTFLTQPLLQDVLKELGVAHPERLLEDLLQEVRKRLLAPSA